jgi:hypothetical protein
MPRRAAIRSDFMPSTAGRSEKCVLHEVGRVVGVRGQPSRQSIEALAPGGTLGAATHPGGGAVFELTLPLA